MLGIIKLILFFIFLLVVFVIHSLMTWMIPGRLLRARLIGRSISCFSSLSLKLLGVDVNVEGDLSELQGKLILCNHMSYLDILCLASKFPTLFMTSVEIKQTIGLGHICRSSNCLFTERRKTKRTPELVKHELEEIRYFLKNGLSLLIFPEGTSTNGAAILTYKTALFEPVIQEQIPVVNLVLNYLTINGEIFSEKNRDLVCWYGDMEFFGHLKELAKLKKITALIKVGSTFETSSVSRQELGKMAHEEARSLFVTFH